MFEPAHRPLVRVAVVVLVALSFLSLAWPFTIAHTPPLVDYPNHVARFWLISGGARDPIMARFYRIDWSNAVTNVGVDHVVAWLSPWFSGLDLGRAAAILAAFAPPLGMLALNLAIFRTLSPWQALFPLAAWSTTFLMGFLNFQIGLGLALVFAAFDPLAQPRLGRGWVLLRIPFGFILATDHLFAVILYATLLAGLGVGQAPLAPLKWASIGRRLARGALSAAWCILPLLILAAMAPHALPGAQYSRENAGNPIQYNLMPGKLATLFSPLASYNVFQELVVFLFLVGLFIWLLRRGALQAHTGLLLAAAGLLLVAIVAPGRAAGATMLDRRFPVMALFCLLASLRLRQGLKDRFVLAVGVASLSLAGLQSAWVGWNWKALDRNLKTVGQVIAAVPPGSALLTVQHDPPLAAKWHAPAGRYMFGVGDPTYRHFGAIGVPTRRLFSPSLFAARGLQPLRVLGDWDRIVEHNGGDLASVSALTRPALPGEPTYIPGWRDHFDYVLVVNADMPDQSGSFQPPKGLVLVSDQGFAQLWRVVKPAGSSPRP